MLTLIKTLFMLYILMAALLYFSQRSMIYFPTSNSTAAAQMATNFAVNDQSIQAWQLNPGKKKALVYFGGNAEAVDANIDEFSTLFSQYTVYLIAYRGYGKSTGAPSENGLNQDAVAIYDELVSEYDSISVMGRSLGSAVAVHLAANRELDKLVLVTPFDSILNVAQDLYWMFPLGILLKDKFESWRKVASIDADTLVIIAEQDEVIPARYGKNLVRYFKVKPELVMVNGANHNNISDIPSYRQALSNFMRE